MEIETLSWHDGVLKEFSFSPNCDERSKIILELELYPEQVHSKIRSSIKLVCENISSFRADIDVNDLKENKNFGNINSGEVNNSTLKIELFGGEIVINADKFNVEC